MTVTSVAEHIDQFQERFVRITREVAKRIVGNEEIVGNTVTALLAGGHVLLEGIPGVGKTSLVHTLSDVLHALFPCGSITGAPKVAAMRRIRQMETAPRGLYCGSVGWLAPDGDFSLNVAIRTLVLDQHGHGVYSVGGGIVYDSDPAGEWQECHWKARILRA